MHSNQTKAFRGPTQSPQVRPHIVRPRVSRASKPSIQCLSTEPSEPSSSQNSQSAQPQQPGVLTKLHSIAFNSFGPASAACLPAIILCPQMGGNGGSGNGNGDGGGGGGGGDNQHSQGPQALYDIAEDTSSESEEEEAQQNQQQETDKQGKKKKKKNPWMDLVTDSEDIEPGPDGSRGGTQRCVEIVIEGWPQMGLLPSAEELKSTLHVQEGHMFEHQDLIDDRRRLELQFGDALAGVEIRTEYVDNKSNHQRVIYKFSPQQFSNISDIEVTGASLLPPAVVEQLRETCLPKESYPLDAAAVDKAKSIVEDWYQNNGFPFCYVGYVDGLDKGIMRLNVIEAKVNDVKVRFVRPKKGGDGDELSEYDEGNVVKAERIIKASGFKKGNHYHVDDMEDATNNIFACGLLDDVQIEPVQEPEDVSNILVNIKVEEVQPKSMEMDLDWTFQVKDGIPQLSRQSLIPGGSVTITHENLFGNSESLSVSLSSSDWRSPAADLGFTIGYTEPFYGPNTTRNLQVFNTRKTSTVFTPGGEAEVPTVYVDRWGAKGWLSKSFGVDSRAEHALLLQRIQTVDENSQPITKGTKVQRGYYADNGPPTTISGTGQDHSLAYQGYVCLDDVSFVNGNQLGERKTFQVDQSMNLSVPLPGGRRLGLDGGLYNKLSASYTKFMQLPGLPKLTNEDAWVKRKAPNTLVLHAKVGNCLGDLPSYEAFALGGPYSVRGYNHGELGAARRFVEAAAEARFPLRNFNKRLNATAYAFVDMAHDLGSSNAVVGNPTQYYRKPGRGMGYGIGIKALGACRLELARDCNNGTNSVLVNFGERF